MTDAKKEGRFKRRDLAPDLRQNLCKHAWLRKTLPFEKTIFARSLLIRAGPNSIQTFTILIKKTLQFGENQVGKSFWIKG